MPDVIAGSNGSTRVARLHVDEHPLVDVQLEREVLGTCALKPHYLIECDLSVHDFFGPVHRTLWSAILAVYAEEGTCDSVRLRSHLHEIGKLQFIGGVEYLLELTNVVLVDGPLPTKRLKRLAVQRRLRTALLHHAELVQDAEASAKYGREIDQLREQLQALNDSKVEQPPARHRLDEHWRTVGDRASLKTVPVPRQWLLMRPDDETNGMGNPIGVLPMGKTGLLVAQGGSGKTIALIQLAISVATGRKWLDHYVVPKPGRVLLALAEEDGEELDRRIHDLAYAMRLTDEQRWLVEQNVVALGLSGEVTSLVTQDGRETVETDVLTYFRRRLAEGEWSLVVLDTLTRFAGGDTEKDSAQATRFIQAVESLCKAPGSPTVLVAHHTNKVSRVEGAVTSASNSRGSSALTDGARWVANLDATSPESVKFEITKSNYAMGGPPVMLTRDSANGGCLSVESPELARLRAEQASLEREIARWESARTRIYVALAQHTNLSSRGEVAAKSGGRKAEVLSVLKDLIESGRVALVGGSYRVVEGVEK